MKAAVVVNNVEGLVNFSFLVTNRDIPPLNHLRLNYLSVYTQAYVLVLSTDCLDWKPLAP